MTLRWHVIRLFLHKHLAMREFRRITGNRTPATMSELNKHLETNTNHLLAVSIVAAVGAVAAGALQLDRRLEERSIPKADFIVPEPFDYRPEGATKSLVLLGGLCMGTHGVAKRYKSQLADGINLFAPLPPNAGFKTAHMHEQVFRALEEQDPDEIYVAAYSKGGVDGLDMFNYGVATGRRDLVERISTFVTRGTPFSKQALRRGPRFAAGAVGLFGPSYALDRSRPLIERWSTESISNSSFSRLAGEVKELRRLYRQAGPIEVQPNRIIQIRGSNLDPVQDDDRSRKALEQRLGRPIEVFIDPRPEVANSHAPSDRKTAHLYLSVMGIAKPAPAEQVELAPAPQAVYQLAAA